MTNLPISNQVSQTDLDDWTEIEPKHSYTIVGKLQNNEEFVIVYDTEFTEKELEAYLDKAYKVYPNLVHARVFKFEYGVRKQMELKRFTNV